MTSPEGGEAVIGWDRGPRMVPLQPHAHSGPALGAQGPAAHLEIPASVSGSCKCGLREPQVVVLEPQLRGTGAWLPALTPQW